MTICIESVNVCLRLTVPMARHQSLPLNQGSDLAESSGHDAERRWNESRQKGLELASGIRLFKRRQFVTSDR